MSSDAKRILIAGLFHETHTFLPGQTLLSDCEVTRGAAMLDAAGDASPLGGAMETAQRLGWDVVPSIDIRVVPGPLVSDEVVDVWWNAVEEAGTGAGPLDGILLILHGAMVSQSLMDVEGEMLERLRSLAGPDMPIAGVTDLHANFSARMATNSNALVTYHENPHTDARASAVRAAELLEFLLQSGKRAVTVFEQTPIVWPPSGTATAADPMRILEEMARKIEDDEEEILAINVHAGYSYADVRDAGVSFSAVTAGAPEKASLALQKMAEIAWEQRHVGNVVEPSFEALWPDIRAAIESGGGGPVVIVEPADNIGGGAPGDGTGLLREFVERQLSSSAVVINDPHAVEQLSALEPGTGTTLPIGGASGFAGAGPLELEVELISTSDGKFALEDAHSHLASMYGLHINMGPCATVRHRLTNGGEVLILLTSSQTPPFDLGQLRSQGIIPEEMAVIGVKAAVAHRRAYDPITRASFSVATPGACTGDLRKLPFKNLRRPIFPLDELGG